MGAAAGLAGIGGRLFHVRARAGGTQPNAVDMQITLKLYAGLAPFLPAGARNNQVVVEVPDGATIVQVLDAQGCPRKLCHLVMHNGFHVPPAEREDRVLRGGDALAAWPPIAGG